MSNYLLKKSIQSEISSLSDMLKRIPEKDIFGRVDFEYRLETLQDELRKLENVPDTTAETVLYFGGEPVEGSTGIKASFASDALKKYQDLVSMLLASHKRGDDLAEDGPIPHRDNSTLHITGAPRGSFGFILSELLPQGSLTDTGLLSAVEKASNLIELSKEPDDESFQDAIAEEHPRVLAYLNQFIGSLRAANATARLVTRDHDITLDSTGIEAASNNTESLSISTDIKILRGRFRGATARSRRFDFEPEDGDLIRGKISLETPDHRIHDMNTEYMDTQCQATFEVVEVLKKNSKSPRRSWTLVDIEPI